MPLTFKEVTLKSLCIYINISSETALMSNIHKYINIILYILLCDKLNTFTI